MKMKKICSVVLIAVMLLSAFSITASASGYIDLNSSVYEVTQFPDNSEELDESTATLLKKSYIDFLYVLSNNQSYLDIDVQDINITYCSELSSGDKLLKFTCNEFLYIDDIKCYLIGSYVYVAPDSGAMLYLYHDGTLYYAWDAYDEGIISDDTLDEIAELLSLDSYPKKIMGDLDLNGYINVADVTVIQKASVKLTALTDEQSELADVNGDGRVSVLDATCIKKYAVGGYSDTGSTGQTVSK